MKGTWWLSSLALVLTVLPVPAGAQGPQPEPAWCGGSWRPAGVNAKGAQVEPGGTNFGTCASRTKTMEGQKVTVPTYPAYPTSTVSFTQDSKGDWVAQAKVTEVGPDGKDTTKLVPLAPRIVK